MMSQTQLRQRPRPERRSQIDWMRRYSVALFFAFCGVVAVAVGWWTGDGGVAVVGAVFMGPYALIAYIGGGRTGRIRTLRGELDEREQVHDYRAFVVSASMVLAVLLVLWVRDLLNGNLHRQAQWLLALFGASYGLTHVYYWWLDRRA